MGNNYIDMADIAMVDIVMVYLVSANVAIYIVMAYTGVV